MQLTTLLCDLDGTLVDARQDITRAFQQAWQVTSGSPAPSVEAIVPHIGRPLLDMLSAVGGLWSPAQGQAFLKVYARTYVQQQARHTHAYPDVIPTLKRLSRFALGIVTTKDPQQAAMVLQRLGLATFFQHVQGGAPGLALKPAPDTLLAALAALHCAPSHALMIGDTPADVLAGKAAGTLTCAVMYGFGARAALLDCAPDYTLESFGDLSALLNHLSP